jgi:hypothetical protein
VIVNSIQIESEYRTWLKLGDSKLLLALLVRETTPNADAVVHYVGRRFSIVAAQHDQDGSVQGSIGMSLGSSSGFTWSHFTVGEFECLLHASWEGNDPWEGLPVDLTSIPEIRGFTQPEWGSATELADEQVIEVADGSIRVRAFIRPAIQIDLSGFPGEFVAINAARSVVAHAPTISQLKDLLGEGWNSQVSILWSPSVAAS